MTEEGSDYEDLLTLKNLNMAAGLSPATPIPSDHGLYQQLCVSCHGDSGQGRGSVASSQNPYPRNFRKGVFKYKATSRNAKPTRDDLVNTLNRGLNGSQMPRFDYLSDQQRVALAEYVIYLSIRGEFERKLLIFAALELDPYESEDPSPDSRLYDPGSESAEDQIEFATDELTLILDDWIDADEEVDEIAVDVEFPVIGFTPDEKINRQELDASIERGKQLFVGSVAACSKCHGVDGIGTGAQLPDYDDWTKDYTSTANIDPKDDDAVLEMLIRGALPPQPIDPRNLVEGKFRGGDDPVNIYRRIKHGIAGAPMPAAALATSPESLGLSESEMWDLVNFVLSLSRVQM
jgi:mono/diheme cytochrome c family protein